MTDHSRPTVVARTVQRNFRALACNQSPRDNVCHQEITCQIKNTGNTAIRIAIAVAIMIDRSRRPTGLAPVRRKTTPSDLVRFNWRRRMQSHAAPNVEQYCSLLMNRLDNVPSARLNCTPASNVRILIPPHASSAHSRYPNAFPAKINSIHARSIR
jgi:hypothetical protein